MGLAKRTSLETIERQTEQELLYKGLENYAETRKGDQAKAMLEGVAEAATTQATQSMLALPDANMIGTIRKAQETESDRLEVVRSPVTGISPKIRATRYCRKRQSFSNQCSRW